MAGLSADGVLVKSALPVLTATVRGFAMCLGSHMVSLSCPRETHVEELAFESECFEKSDVT